MSTIWQAVWDKEAKAYYYWNPETSETTWDNPDEKKVGIDKGKAPNPENATTNESETKKDEKTEEQKAQEYYSSKEYYDWYMENAATLNATSVAPKAGRYADLASNQIYEGALQNDQNSFAIRQMGYFFDLDKYQNERAMDRAKPKEKKHYTKKELEKFKIKKKEKKMKSLLERMGAD